MADLREVVRRKDPGPGRGMPGRHGHTPRRSTVLLRGLLIFELVNAAYLAAFDSATIFYHVQVVAHVVAGFLLVLVLIARGPAALRRLRDRCGNAKARAWLAVVGVASFVAVATSLMLAVTGTATRWRPILCAHIGSAVAAFAAGIAWQAARGNRAGARRATIALLIVLALPVSVRARRWLFPPPAATIVNPT